MNPPVNTANLSQPFTGWDELRSSGPAWKIEKPQVFQRYQASPFFPDQNGKVYEQLLANIPIMLVCLDGGGRIVTANARWVAALGYPLAEVSGRSFNELLAPDSRTRLVQQIYPAYLQSGSCRGELLTIMRHDGAPLQVILSMTAYRGDRGRIERSICVIEEPVSVVAPAPVQASAVDDLRFRGAFESAGHGMALISPLGEVTFGNAAFWEFLGCVPEARQGVSLEGALTPEDRRSFLAAMAALIQGARPSVTQEFRYLAADDKLKHGATSVALVRNEAGDIEQIIVQIIDVTDIKHAERKLQQAQRMEAIGQMTGGLAHDFNNLLTVVIGNLELLEGRLATDEKGARRLAEAIHAARKGSDLTRQMLAFARKQVLEPREVKINELVGSMTSLLQRSVGEAVQVKVDVMPGEPKALIDPVQLESSILNLSINARDAMPKGGLLTIETAPAYLDETYARRHPDVTAGHYVMVAVTDTGSGMSQELLEKVFQPFFTTKEHGKGSGLGLAMVYGFLKQSGGHISVYSEVECGTAMKMYLPRRFAEGEEVPAVPGVSVAQLVPPPAAEPAAQAAPAPRLVKILVVEDQEAVRAVACGFLEDFGYATIEAEDGLQALSRLQEHPDVDLMFSDVVMPGGLNGFDLAQAARGIRPGLKIVHTSGYPKGAMVHQEEPRFREGFIIMKPYRREELHKIIKDALELQV